MLVAELLIVDPLHLVFEVLLHFLVVLHGLVGALDCKSCGFSLSFDLLLQFLDSLVHHIRKLKDLVDPSLPLRLGFDLVLSQEVVGHEFGFDRTDLELLGWTVVFRLGIALVSSASAGSLQVVLYWTLVLKVISDFFLDLVKSQQVTAAIGVQALKLH